MKDVKAAGTQGGGFTSGAWRTRDLNTLEGDNSFISLNANQFTLDAGTYIIEASAPADRVSRHKIRLRNITDNVTAITGSSAWNQNASNNSAMTVSQIEGQLTINSQKTFEIQHRCSATRANDGFGTASITGEVEIYTQVKITKIAN